MDPIDTSAAHIAICNAKSRHIRLLDTGQLDEYAAMLTEDFEMDVQAVAPIPVITGRDAAMAVLRQMVAIGQIVHHVHIPSMRFEGTTAHVDWPMQDILIPVGDQARSLGFGYHHDRWVLQDGTWKLAAQRLSRLHSEPLPAAEARP